MTSTRGWRRTVGRTLLGVAALALLVSGAYLYPRSGTGMPEPAADLDIRRHTRVAVFGATGLVGEGVLAAMLRDPGVQTVHVVARRRTPELDAAAATGRARVWLHLDYLDYAALAPMLAEVDAVYWALGTSTWNVTNEEYSTIHVDYPARFVSAWLAARGTQAPMSFHLVSGSGASAGAWFHWAREKARAERTLATLANGTGLRVVSYRPGGILRTGARDRWYLAPLRLLKPLGRAIEPTEIGAAMLEVTARGSQTAGAILENGDLLRYSRAYHARLGR